jgi:ankyrin repeat protein
LLCLAGENGTALHIAAAFGYLDIVSLWCLPGLNIDIPMADGVTPLHIAVVNNRVDVAKKLCLSNGGSRDCARSDGASPIYLATERKHTEMMKMLIGLGADVNKRTTYDNVSPLMKAIEVGFSEGFHLLLDAKPDLDDVSIDGGTAMYMASERNQIEMVRALCASGADKEAAGFLERRPLHAAADFGFLEVARSLLDNNAEVDAEMRGTWTPLHLSAHKGHLEVVKLLCACGANIAREIGPGMSPVCLAANSKHEDVARFLVEQNADLDCPLQAAIDGDHLELAHFLNSLRYNAEGLEKKSVESLRGPEWSMSPKSAAYAMKVNQYLEAGLMDA